ncbi:MAG: bifunctional glutamine-synthetase adenylyltransferase/deadenyltransferase, partial [Phenylobacterium zucineum]
AEFEKPVLSLDNQEQMSSRFSSAVDNSLRQSGKSQDAWVALRVAYRRELLRIAIFDVSQPNQEAALPVVAAALSDAAGAALDAGITIARHELANSTEFGNYTAQELKATRLSVIAMGKCGARELNYISDVDVIFAGDSADPAVETTRALDIATKLATRMMRAMDAVAPEPGLWQVDPNLRPEGKSGALVRTVESHKAYYERWAESWEFQALLKARPIAGDAALGQAYFDAMNPFVWQSASRENFVESAQKMRERVMGHIPSNEVDWEIKLGPGGLRDVEFTVQLLQLVHGRTDESVRTQDTLTSLQALAVAGYIGRQEAEIFSAHYRFLRLLEHRIQLTQLRRTHLMPQDDAKQRVLARSLAVGSTAEALLDRWQAVKLDVRSLHQKLFYRPLLGAVAKLGDGGLELTSDQAQDRLKAIGFTDPRGALAHIAALTGGLSRRAAIQRQLLPVLLQWFAEGTDPDAALLAFRRLSEDLGESHWYLRMLRDSSGAAQRMTTALSNSKLVQDLLEKVPEGAAWFEDSESLQPTSRTELLGEIAALAERHESSELVAATVRSIRRRETLRLALGGILGDLTIDQIYEGLTDLMEAYLQGMLQIIYDFDEGQIADRPVPQVLDFCIIAMGRFGGAELGFGSDADVMFVYEKSDQVNGDYAQKVAERVIAELKRLTLDPTLEFELDSDLRPEGKNGAVVRSLESYAAYYERWADHWEAQALTRARVVAGSVQLAAKFTELINVYRYPKRMSAEALAEIRRIKRVLRPSDCRWVPIRAAT